MIRANNNHPNSPAQRRHAALGAGLRVGLGIFALAFALCSGAAAPVSEQFEAANRLYEQGKFPEAAKGFEKIIASDHASAALYFNLGNAFFKAGELGRALAAYEQAEQLAPRDPDLRANLQFARKQVQGPTLTMGWRERWLGQLTLNEWTGLAMAALWLWFLLLIARQLRPKWKRALRNYTLAMGLIAVALGLGLLGAWQNRSAAAVIVTAREAPARQAPLDESATVFTAHDGARLEVLDRKGDWLQVSAGARNRGWIRRDQAVIRNANLSG